MEPSLRAYLAVAVRARAALAATGSPRATERVLAGVAVAVARQAGVRLGDLPLLAHGTAPGAALDPPSRHAGPELLGLVHQALTAPADRRARGVHYTPRAVARLLVDRTLAEVEPTAHRVPAVCDPAVGGGAFLLAAAGALASRGLHPRLVVASCLFGVDLDPLAVAVSEAALALWAGDGRPPPEGRLLVGDGLGLAPPDWDGAPLEGFDAVVGNPPFLGQLNRATARGAGERRRATARFGPGRGAYTDGAALFLLAALDLARPGGAVCLLQPESVLAARDAAGVRAVAAARGALRAMWLGGPGHFDAGVRVCAPVITVGGEPAAAVEVLGPAGELLGRAAPAPARAWAALLADAHGVPDVPALAVGGRLGDRFGATAGFRDEYYGLAGHVVEWGDGNGGGLPLVTTGLVDPGICHWGRRTARFAGRAWDAPVVDRSALAGDTRLARWLRRVLVPKVVVAPQTKVGEAAVDESGTWVPSTPLIAVTGPPERLWHAAAALCGPVASAWAAREAAGTGLAADTIRLRAAQLLGAPIPPDGPDLDRAAAALRAASMATDGHAWRAAVLEAGAATCRAHRVTDEGLLAWWAGRLPVWR